MALIAASFSLSVLGVLSHIKPSVAQQIDNTSLFEGSQPNEYDSSDGSGLSSLDPMELYHQINLSRGRNPDQFSQDSQQGITDAAADFKRQQQQIQQQDQTSTEDNY